LVYNQEMNEEILKTIRERGLLLEKEIYELVENFGSPAMGKEFLENLEKVSGQKFITKNILNKNYEYVRGAISDMPGDKNVLEKVFVKLGLSVEVIKEKIVEQPVENRKMDYQLFYSDTKFGKKLEVKDFVGHFRSRYQQLQKILMQRPELKENLVSIGKIGSDRATLAIIGIVTEKRITKNKNLIIRLEDLTGEVNLLVKFDKECFSKAEELQLDDVVGVRASGSRDILFAHDIFFPDSFKFEKVRFEEDISVAFLSDLHVGSGRHLRKSFERFLEWVSSEDEQAKKIKYIFFVGDNVDGTGIFPGQEEWLELKSMNVQYEKLAEYLKKIPSRITMFMCPGQHDASIVSEPQPIISQKYAPELHELENLVLVTNPCMVKLIEGEKEFKILMYHGASLHVLINEIKELREIKAATCPAKSAKHLLKRRHLASSHGVSTSIVYTPNGKEDPLVISEVPDVFTTGEMHRADIENYNGVLIISNSCWQAQTPFEEKTGNFPNPCKVPILNLKTRELKILDFRDDSEVDDSGTWREK